MAMQKKKKKTNRHPAPIFIMPPSSILLQICSPLLRGRSVKLYSVRNATPKKICLALFSDECRPSLIMFYNDRNKANSQLLRRNWWQGYL